MLPQYALSHTRALQSWQEVAAFAIARPGFELFQSCISQPLCHGHGQCHRVNRDIYFQLIYGHDVTCTHSIAVLYPQCGGEVTTIQSAWSGHCICRGMDTMMDQNSETVMCMCVTMPVLFVTQDKEAHPHLHMPRHAQHNHTHMYHTTSAPHGHIYLIKPRNRRGWTTQTK